MLLFLKVVAIILIVGLIGVALGLLYLNHWAKFFVNAAVERKNRWYRDDGLSLVNPGQNQHVDFSEELNQFWDKGKKWTLDNAEKLRLSASVFRQPGKKWVVLVHDYRSNGYQDCADLAYEYYQKGWNVLVPDLRAHGQSEGEIIGLGWQDRLDLLLWLAEIRKRELHAEIILHGLSMGAAAVLMTSGEKMPDNVKLMIADSCYTSVYSEFKMMLKKLTKYPVNRFMGLANSYAKRKMGYSLIAASVTRQLGSNHLPVLFLHGENDQFVPLGETTTLMEATAGEKVLVTFPECDHLSAKSQEKVKYWQEVNSFIEKYS